MAEQKSPRKPGMPGPQNIASKSTAKLAPKGSLSNNASKSSIPTTPVHKYLMDKQGAGESVVSIDSLNKNTATRSR